jgi:hypothetical protein
VELARLLLKDQRGAEKTTGSCDEVGDHDRERRTTMMMTMEGKEEGERRGTSYTTLTLQAWPL